jgi:hypothetical protein
MNAYALAPFIATVAYIPLLIITISNRPWQRRQLLFFIFLVCAMLWSLVDFLYRGNYFPEFNDNLFKTVVILFTVMVVQFQCFTSSFYPKGQSRWLPFAYLSLIPISAFVIMGFVTNEIIYSNGYVYSTYRPGAFLIGIPLVALAIRNFYVFGKMLKNLNNPVLHNQVIALILGISVLTVTTALSVPSWHNAFPIPHYGNLIVAFVTIHRPENI